MANKTTTKKKSDELSEEEAQLERHQKMNAAHEEAIKLFGDKVSWQVVNEVYDRLPEPEVDEIVAFESNIKLMQEHLTEKFGEAAAADPFAVLAAYDRIVANGSPLIIDVQDIVDEL